VSVAAEPSNGHSHGETSPAHEHAHAHSSRELDPQDKFGISSFVYTRRRPFHPERLKKLIAKLPVSAGQDKEALEGWVLPERETAAEVGKDNPLRNIIRSKGFVWVSTYHRVALYWSHAGQFFDLKDFGMFWAATPLKYWPRETAERAQVIADFGMGEKWGDRRQEIVFIGVGMQQDKIEAIVDQALLTDAEMEEYEQSNKSTPDKVKMDWTTSPPIPVEMAGTPDKRK
jgi:G3E family GTPase